jgi:hypothetical protein
MSELNNVNNLEQKAEAAPPRKKTGMQKFLNFLAMGGFLLVILVGVILAVVISVWANSCQATP